MMKQRPTAEVSGRPAPRRSMSCAATRGPMTRAPLNIELFRPMAFGRSSLPTSSMRNAWRAGMSKTCVMPRRPAKIGMCQSLIWPVITRRPMVRARMHWMTCIERMRLRFGIRSASAPPMKAPRNIGSAPRTATMPSHWDACFSESESRVTSQFWPVDWTQVPMSEKSCPM